MITTDPYNLHRFLGAQESFYEQALKEMRKRLPKLFWIVMEQLETKMTL